MKKVKISLASLAIVLAVTSAFTTVKFDTPPTADRWYTINSGRTVTAPSSVPNALVYNATDFNSGSAALNPPSGGSGICGSISTQVCAAFFNSSGANAADPNNQNLFVVTGGLND